MRAYNYDQRYLQHFFSKGGKVEWAIAAVIGFAEDQYEDGEFEETFGAELAQLPQDPIGDDDFAGVRSRLLPGIDCGPFGADDLEDISDEDEDDSEDFLDYRGRDPYGALARGRFAFCAAPY